MVVFQIFHVQFLFLTYTDEMYRKPEDKVTLPSIPVYPVSYEDASRFLE